METLWKHGEHFLFLKEKPQTFLVHINSLYLLVPIYTHLARNSFHTPSFVIATKIEHKDVHTLCQLPGKDIFS